MSHPDLAFLRQLEHSSTVHEFTQDDDGQEVRLHPEGKVIIRLPEPVGQEGKWQLSWFSFPTFLRFLGSVYDEEGPDRSSEIISGPNQRAFVFEVRGGVIGASPERLAILERQNDDGSESDKEFAIVVFIDEA